MKEIITALLCIQAILVYIIDLSGVMDTIKRLIWKWLKPHTQYRDYDLKPISCSLCMMFWVGLIYLLVCHSFTLPNFLLVCLASYLTTTTSSLLSLIKDFLDMILFRVGRIINGMTR